MTLILHFIYSVLATFFFALIMYAPKKALIPIPILAGFGYMIFELIFTYQNEQILGYFCGTLFIATGGEILARTMRMPSIMFVFPAIIPLVPGIGIYRTMLTLVENRPQNFSIEAINTLFIAGAMAVAIAIVNVLARNIYHVKQDR